MFNLQDLEKKINSELGTKIKDSKINHGQIYIAGNHQIHLYVTSKNIQKESHSNALCC